MSAYALTFIVTETVLLFVLVALLAYKSTKIERLSDEIEKMRESSIKHDREQKEKDDFLAMLVHELRSPLAVMKGAADLILKDATKLSKEQIELLLGQIRSSSNGMLKIVNDILDVSKLESGKFSITKAFGNFNSVLKEECDYYMPLANSKQIQLKCNLDDTLPGFNFDSDRIRQVLNNLISNAIKFTPENGVILITSQKHQEMCRISVSDSGDGISDDAKHKLFHKFVQLHNAHSKEKGTGLGLFIAKGIVEAHGGHIWIEDNSPKGSIFVFDLPVK